MRLLPDCVNTVQAAGCSVQTVVILAQKFRYTTPSETICLLGVGLMEQNSELKITTSRLAAARLVVSRWMATQSAMVYKNAIKIIKTTQTKIRYYVYGRSILSSAVASNDVHIFSSSLSLSLCLSHYITFYYQPLPTECRACLHVPPPLVPTARLSTSCGALFAAPFFYCLLSCTPTAHESIEHGRDNKR